MTNKSTLTVRRSISLPALTAISVTTGLEFQVLGLYAMWITFGTWMTLGVYTIGALTIVLQFAIAGRRVASWSAGE